MKQNIYLFSNTLIKRKNNTIALEKICNENEDNYYEEFDGQDEYFLGDETEIPSGDKKYIPVEGIESVFSFGSIRFNSRFLYFLSRNQIPMHIFSYTGNYSGSFIPSERTISGTTLIKQVSFYKHRLKRLEIASQITTAAISNSIANLKYYFNRGAHISDYIEQLNEILSYTSHADSVDELMGFEGIAKRCYYSCWKHIFAYPVEFTTRVKKPPNNLINALISYGNTIVYSVCLNEIYRSRLYPEIGFIHQPGEGKLSLSYDMAEIFKPLITDRAIFKVINKNMISENDAFTKNGRCIIKKKAKQVFVQELENKLLTKIKLEGKTVRYTYRRMIREECYKLIKHLNDEENYKPYITKW